MSHPSIREEVRAGVADRSTDNRPEPSARLLVEDRGSREILRASDGSGVGIARSTVRYRPA